MAKTRTVQKKKTSTVVVQQRSSRRLSSLAARVMREAEDMKTLAGSVLAQAVPTKRSTVATAAVAARILKDDNASFHARELAGSVLTQR